MEIKDNPDLVQKASILAAQIALCVGDNWFTADNLTGKKNSPFKESVRSITNRLETLKLFNMCISSGANVGGKFKTRYKIILTLPDRIKYAEHRYQEKHGELSALYKELTGLYEERNRLNEEKNAASNFETEGVGG